MLIILLNEKENTQNVFKANPWIFKSFEIKSAVSKKRGHRDDFLKLS